MVASVSSHGPHTVVAAIATQLRWFVLHVLRILFRLSTFAPQRAQLSEVRQDKRADGHQLRPSNRGPPPTVARPNRICAYNASRGPCRRSVCSKKRAVFVNQQSWQSLNASMFDQERLVYVVAGLRRSSSTSSCCLISAHKSPTAAHRTALRDTTVRQHEEWISATGMSKSPEKNPLHRMYLHRLLPKRRQ